MVTGSSPQTIGRRYVLHERLGAGGMGAVYRATDRLSGQQVALKRVTIPAEQLEFIAHDHGADPNLALAQEFKALASLCHPNIIHVLDYGFDQERRPYFTMDLLEDTQTIVTAGQGQGRGAQVELLVQVLQALVYLHRRNVLHRDLKPENVLVVDGQVRVLDFGLSVITSRTMEHLTQTTAGTMAYMAPELFQGAPVTRAADLYAVGVMAYELFAGRHPFDTRNMAVLLNDVLNVPADVWSIDVGDELAGVLERLLAKARAERYDDAGEVIRDLCAATGCAAPAETDEIRESFLQAARFVGRERELEQLSGALDAALAGRGSAWLVGGESGIGKSRLVDELRILALVAGASVLRGQAIREGSRPFHLWRDVLRRLALTTDLTVREASVLKPLVPDIADWVGMNVPDAPPLDPKPTQTRLMWTTSQVFERQEHPLVVILEDLQWARSESLALLDRLTQRVGPGRLLLVGTYRNEERPHLPDELPKMQVLRLERLKEQGVAELSVSMLGPVGRREPVLDLLQRETQGNPFFLVEVVRALAEEAGRLDGVDVTVLPVGVFADGVSSLVQRRLNRVPQGARRLLQLAAVAGQELDLDLLRALAPVVDLDRWLTTCAGVAVLEVGAGRWRFAHDRLREGALDALPEGARPELHRQVAETLERSFPERVEGQAALLAYHYARAEVWEKAQEYLLKAGDQAGRVAADAEALAHYQQAIVAYARAFGDRWDPVQRATLERKMGEALFRRGQVAQALECMQRALAYLGQSLPMLRRRVRLALLREIVQQIGHRLLPRVFLRYAGGPVSPAIEEAIHSYKSIAYIQAVAANPERLLLVVLRMLNVSERSGSFYGAAVGSAALGAASDLIPIFWLAEGYHRRAVALAEQIQVSDALGTAYIGLMMHGCCLGEWDATVEYSQKAVEIHQKTGDLHGWGLATVFLAHASNYRGNFTEALIRCRDLVRFGQEGTLPEVQCWGLGQQGFCQRHLGQVDEAITVLQEAIALAKAIPDYAIHVLAGGELGRCYLCQGQLQQALSTLQANQQVYVEHGTGWGTNSALFNGLAEAHLLVAEQGNRTARVDRLQKAKYACRAALKQGTAFRGGLPEAMMLRGRYEWLRGKPTTAKKWWQRSLTLAGEMGQRYDLGLTHLEMGQRLGERPHLERAVAILAEIGAEWDLARAREALSQTPAA